MLPLFTRASLEGRAPHAAVPTRSRVEEEDGSGPTVARALSRALERVLPSLLSRPSACSLPAVRACVALATAFHLSAAVAAFLPTPERPAFKASALTIARPIIQATRNSGMDSLYETFFGELFNFPGIFACYPLLRINSRLETAFARRYQPQIAQRLSRKERPFGEAQGLAA